MHVEGEGPPPQMLVVLLYALRVVPSQEAERMHVVSEDSRGGSPNDGASPMNVQEVSSALDAVLSEDAQRDARVLHENAQDLDFPIATCCRVCLQYDLQSEIRRYDDYDLSSDEDFFYAHQSCHETGHRTLVICERCHMTQRVLEGYDEDCRPANEYQWVNGFQIPGPSHGAHVYVTVTVAGNSPALDALNNSTMRTI